MEPFLENLHAGRDRRNIDRYTYVPVKKKKEINKEMNEWKICTL